MIFPQDAIIAKFLANGTLAAGAPDETGTATKLWVFPNAPKLHEPPYCTVAITGSKKEIGMPSATGGTRKFTQPVHVKFTCFAATAATGKAMHQAVQDVFQQSTTSDGAVIDFVPFAERLYEAPRPSRFGTVIYVSVNEYTATAQG